jgi:IS30 family transposase
MEKFSQLSYQERGQIYRGLCDGLSSRQIAKRLERPPSTISREIQRNSDRIGYLYAGDAHQRSIDRRNKNKPKIDQDVELQDYIITKLHERWSPRIIAQSWSQKYGDRSISAETIYQWIYGEKGEKLGLKKLLIRARKKRGTKRKPMVKKIKNRVSVHERPDSINQRIELGHYECDLMFNSGSQSQNVCTLVERVTRHATLILNESKHTKIVIDALIKHIKTTGMVVKSITFDNGSEFVDHTELNGLGIATYFCDPGSPWQKGSIENLNGVSRRYLPFDMPYDEITQDYMIEVNQKMNNMPRAILGFKTPIEALKEAECFAR